MVEKEGEIIFLKGKRVYLRPLEKEDIPQLQRWINDEEVTSYLTAYLPITKHEEEEWFERLGKRKQTDMVLAIRYGSKNALA